MRVGAQRQSLHSNRNATHGGVRGTLRLFTSASALSDSSSNSGRLRLPLEAPPHDYDHRADVLSDTLAVVESRHPELLDLVHKGATTWLRLTCDARQASCDARQASCVVCCCMPDVQERVVHTTAATHNRLLQPVPLSNLFTHASPRM